MGCLIGLGVVLGTLLLGAGVGARVSKLFVGADSRVSTSKTIAAVWTMALAAALFGFVYANLLNHPQALSHTGGNVGQYAVLFGGPLGSAILAKQIVNNQLAGQSNLKPPGTPSAKDLIANDAGDADLGDFQYVLFNTVAMFYFVSTLLHAPLHGLPHIPDVLLGLTSVSAVGYVGKKAIPPPAGITAKLHPAPVGAAPLTPVTIELAGLPAPRTHVNALVQFGQSGVGQVASSSVVANGNATLRVTPPPIAFAPGTAVDVSVVTEDGAVLGAGKYTY